MSKSTIEHQLANVRATARLELPETWNLCRFAFAQIFRANRDNDLSFRDNSGELGEAHLFLEPEKGDSQVISFNYGPQNACPDVTSSSIRVATNQKATGAKTLGITTLTETRKGIGIEGVVIDDIAHGVRINMAAPALHGASFLKTVILGLSEIDRATLGFSTPKSRDEWLRMASISDIPPILETALLERFMKESLSVRASVQAMLKSLVNT